MMDTTERRVQSLLREGAREAYGAPAPDRDTCEKCGTGRPTAPGQCDSSDCPCDPNETAEQRKIRLGIRRTR